MTNNCTHIGELLCYLRKRKKMSQTELADGIYSREYIGQIEKGHLLLDLVTEYENSGVTIEGELLQYICYAKSLYYGNIDHQFEKAIEYSLYGIRYHYPDFTPTGSYESYHLSNIELVLLQCLFNHYYRIGDLSRSLIGHKNLFEYLTQKLNTSDYIVHKRLHFELTGLALISHNLSIHGQTMLPLTELLSMINTSITLLKRYGYTENLHQWLEQNK